MFEDIRIKMADKSKYKDIIIKSNNRVKKRLLDKYYKDMNINDVFEILLTMDNDTRRDYLLNKLDISKVNGSDLDNKGIDLFMSLSEEERISLIKKIHRFGFVKSDIFMNLLLSFKDSNNIIDIINYSNDLVRPEFFNNLGEEEVIKIINSDIFNLEQRLELINSIGKSRFVTISKKSGIFVEMLKKCNDKEKMVAIFYNINEKIKDKKVLLDLFKNISGKDLLNINNLLTGDVLKNMGFELDSDGNLDDKYVKLFGNDDNYNYLKSNKLSNIEILEFIDIDKLHEILKYREDSLLSDELGKILKECFKDHYDVNKFIDYIANDDNNIFSDVIRMKIIDKISLKGRGLRSGSWGSSIEKDTYLLFNNVISSDNIVKIMSKISKEKIIEYFGKGNIVMNIKNNIFSLLVDNNLLSFNSISIDEFMKLDDFYKSDILEKMNNKELESAISANPFLIRYLYGSNDLEKLTNIAINNGYIPNLEDINKYHNLRDNIYIMDYMVKNGNLDVIAFYLDDNNHHKITLQCLDKGYVISKKTFDYLGNYKCHDCILIEEAILSGVYNEYNDKFDSSYFGKRIEFLKNIVNNNSYNEDNIMGYLYSYRGNELINYRVINHFLDNGYIPSRDFINKIESRIDDKNVLSTILLKSIKNNPKAIIYIDKASTDLYIKLYKDALDIDSSLIVYLKEDIEELYRYAVEEKGYKIDLDTIKVNTNLNKSKYIMLKAIDKDVDIIRFYSGDDLEVYKSAIDKDVNCLNIINRPLTDEIYKYAVEEKGYKIDLDVIKNNVYLRDSKYIMLKAIDKDINIIDLYGGDDLEVYKYAIDKDINCLNIINKRLNEEVYKYALSKGFKPTKEILKNKSSLTNSFVIMQEALKIDITNIEFLFKTNILEDTLELYFKDNPVSDYIANCLFKNGKFDNIINLEKKGYNLQSFYSDIQKKLLDEYKKIKSKNMKNIYIDYVLKNMESINYDTIEDIVDILYRIENSNASEMKNFGYNIAKQILDKDNPLMYFYKVEDIFVKNNIPNVGKIFHVFKVLHENGELNSKINSNSLVSPTLKKINNMKYRRDDVLDAVIFSDLLKSSLGSNNRSMRDYLYNIERGTLLYKGIITDTINYDNLESSDKETLSVYASHLNAIYNNTNEGKKHNRQLVGDTKRDIEELSKLFKVSEISELPDRIVSDFGHFLGLKSFKEVKDYFETITKITDERNRITAEKGNFKIEVGDFVKGIDLRYLENILQNGSVAKEFLGDSSSSDATPLDTDLSRITIESDNINNTINNTAANGCGEVYLVFKNDGKFSITRKSNMENDKVQKKDTHGLEAFYTGVCNTDKSRHYGVRTGLASSNIDYIVVNNYNKRYGFEIARNGFYIPVVDRNTGKLVFSPKDYDKLRSRMQGMSYYGINTYSVSNNLNIDEFNLNINDESITIPGIESIVSTLENNDEEVKFKRDKIIIPIKEALADLNLKLKTTIDGDVSLGYAELIDTGSTGRGTNVPGDGDFDFMMRLDTEIFTNPEKMNKVREILQEKLKPVDNVVITVDGDLRLKGVVIPGLDNKVDIDISFVKKTNKLSYSTDMALKDRMTNIKKQDSTKYKYIVANIILAKMILKKFNVYKPNRGDNPQGGLGGVGVENWILQNNGSLIDAINDFLKVARKCNTLDDFKNHYYLMDFGENFLAEKKGNYPYDDFIYNMSNDGYLKMKNALENIVNILEKNGELGLIDSNSNITDETKIIKDTYTSEEDLIHDTETILKESLKRDDIKLVSTNMGQTGKMYEFTIDGVTYLVKPGVNKGNGKVRPARAEVQESASTLQQLLSPDRYVEVKTFGNGNVKVAVQRKIENAKRVTNEKELIKNHTKELLYEYAVDYLMGNFDSDVSNFIIDENNNLLGIDKEQSFKYLLDDYKGESLNLDFSYSPVGSRTNVYPNLLNYIKENGKIDEVKEIIEDIKNKINSISDKDYIEIFRKYANSYDSFREEKILEKILERKNYFLNNIDDFIYSLCEDNVKGRSK